MAYQSAILHQPDYTPTYYLMAAVLEKLGRWNESAHMGAQYLEKAPNGVYAPQAKQLVAFVQTQSHIAMMPENPATNPANANTPPESKSTVPRTAPRIAPQGDGVARGYVQAP
jgi:hypothetical protein